MKVEIFHNITQDEQGRRAGLLGYRPGHELVKVYEYDAVRMECLKAAEDAFLLANGQFADSEKYYDRRLRSLQVGDAVRIEGVWLARASVGFDVLEDEPNDITDGFEGRFGTHPWSTEAAPLLRVDLTPASHELFMALAEDAGNWSGTPPTDGNVQIGKEGRGNLTQLKRAGLLTTFQHDGTAWVRFTALGVQYAKAHGVDDLEAMA
ncbi:hypothetical protein [Thermomonospora umbrina]|nr:hypothetical protein [Thermomonospora umbrina]